MSLPVTNSVPPAGAGARRRFFPRLWTRREVLCPTLAGWALLVLVAGGAGAGWWWCGEDFLAVTNRPGNEVLVVEGWIGHDGVRAAAAEFRSGRYHYAVATGGGMARESWDAVKLSYAEVAERDLLAAGVPRTAVILAIPRETEEQRTFECAMATRSALARQSISPHFLTVFTIRAHARRSRAIFAKAAPSGTKVGVIAWRPPDEGAGPWWHSSDRAEEFLKETVGTLYEFLCDSGRVFHPSRFPSS
jgi:hypothetical protein